MCATSRSHLLSLLTATAALLVASPAQAQRMVLLVRHAEKVDPSVDALLSAAGQARATRLAAMLRDAGVGALYATPLKRTQQTLQPLADRLRLTIQKRAVD